MAFCKRVGAWYFFAMANHHDNFDLWASRHHAWNAAALGPQKDLVGGWAAAARSQGLRFGVNVHAAHAWSWYESGQGADREAPLAGVPYDGKLTKADRKGTWWEGLDPQELYAQNHTPSPEFFKPSSIHGRWNWDNGASHPDAAYCEAFYNRTVDLLNQHHPDLIYFDDTALPRWPVSDAGLQIAAHFYNQNLRLNGSVDNGVLFGKILTESHLDFVLGKPGAALSLTRLATPAGLLGRAIARVRHLGAEETVRWRQDADALVIEPPASAPGEESVVFELTLR